MHINCEYQTRCGLYSLIIRDECRNPKDNKYLELAVSGKTECITTKNDDLLVLNPFRGIEIIGIQDFLARNYYTSIERPNP